MNVKIIVSAIALVAAPTPAPVAADGPAEIQVLHVRDGVEIFNIKGRGGDRYTYHVHRYENSKAIKIESCGKGCRREVEIIRLGDGKRER